MYVAANAVGKEYSEVERAYLAGFLDADGAIMATIEAHPEKKFNFRVRVELKITQSKKPILEWFLAKYNVGYIRQNKTTFDWVIRDQKAAQQMIKKIKSYLRVKKPQAHIAEEILNVKIQSSKDLIRAARLADTLSRLNVRSKNRRKNHVSMIEEYFSPND